MKQVTINLYSFNELSEEAKEKAILRHLDFMDSIMEDYEDENGEMKRKYIEHTEQDAKESIEANEYLFFHSGNLAHCTTYTGKHEKAGITEFHFEGQTFKTNS